MAADTNNPAQAPSAAEDSAVRFERVEKRFGDVMALRGVSLSIKRGEFMTLLGPSGCGKTTLLNLVAGFFSPDGGRILIDGELVNDMPTYKREIGMMFQNYALFPHMTVAGNVAYGLKMRHVASDEIKRRVSDALALVKLTGFEDRKPKQLSGGQQQRVALARALVINPKVLLLDEPLSALDKNLRASMQVELREIQRKLGLTTIFVTHDQGEALSLSDRVAVMSEGEVRQVGTPSEIYAAPRERFVASFVGDVNVLRGRFERLEGADAIVSIGAAKVRMQRQLFTDMESAMSVDIFVRPEHIQITELAGTTELPSAIVSSQIYQGGHVDLYLESVDSISGPVLVRVSGDGSLERWPVGKRVGLSFSTGNPVVFRTA